MPSNVDNRSSNFAIHRVIVNNLKEDGVICDAYTKEYDEQKTFEGGTGNRLAFKNYNDKIITYHKILKNLTGEQRANISESIPVIDFAHTENTSLMATYPFKNGSTTEIDPTISIDISSDANSTSTETSALEYIINEDESIINRALAGENMAEHFYNTKSDAILDANVQVSPWAGDKAVIYRGIITPTIIDLDTGIAYSSLRHDAIKVHKVTESESYSIKPLFAGEYDYDNHMTPLEREVLDEKGNTIAAMTSMCNGSAFVIAADEGVIDTELRVPLLSRDENGVLILDSRNRPVLAGYDEVNGFYKEESVTVPIHTNFILKLVRGDVLVVLPSTAYNSDPCRLLIFKANYSASSDSYNGINNGKYFFYVLELATYDAPVELTDVAYEGILPDYIDDNNILYKLNEYTKCEREYYTKASGLMDGYYCEPFEWQEMGDSRQVTRWIMSSDVDTAEERGIQIDIGSMYFRGHLLGRGDFKDQPFAITEPEEAGYPGKATYFYDKIKNSAGVLLDNVTLPYEEWQEKAGSKVVALDDVVSKKDYVGTHSEYGESMDSSVYNDLFGDSVNNYSYPPTRVKYRQKFVKENGEIASYSDFQSYMDSCREHLFSDEEEGTYVFYADLRSDNSACWRYRVTTKEGKRGHTSDINDTGVPGDNNIIKDVFEKIYYLDITANTDNKNAADEWDDEMGTVDLSIASPINVFASNSGGDIFLIYPEYNKFFPDEVYLISRNKLPLEEYSKDPDTDTLGMCSFYNVKERKVICFKVDEVISFLPSKISKIQVWLPMYDHKTDLPYSYLDKKGLNEDCYIYVLKPMEINVANIELKGPDREPVEFESGLETLRIMAMSYPNNYFPMSIDSSSGTARYVIDLANRNTDIVTLKNSYIIAGLPDYNTPEDFYKMTAGSAFDLGIFGDMLSNEDGMARIIDNVLKKVLSSVINNWPMSDSETNPMVFEDLPYVLEGLIELKPELYNLMSSQYTIPYIDPDTGNLKTIREDDLNGLYRRIDYSDTYEDYQYEVEVNRNLDEWDFTADESFSEILNRRLDCITYDVSNKVPMKRPSIRELKNIIDSILEEADFTREDCEKLDSYLGNGTTAFLKTGYSFDTLTTPTSMVNLAKQIGELAETVVKETDQQYKYLLGVISIAEVYGKYYTKESMYKSFGVQYIGDEDNDSEYDWEYDGSSGITTPYYYNLVIDYNGTVLDDDGNPAPDENGNKTEYSEVDAYILDLKGTRKGLGNINPQLEKDAKILNFKEFKDKYELYQPEPLTELSAAILEGRNYIVSEVTKWVERMCETELANVSQGTVYQPLTEEEIRKYAYSYLDKNEDGEFDESDLRLNVREVDNNNGTFSMIADFMIPNLQQEDPITVAQLQADASGEVTITGTTEKLMNPVMKLTESGTTYSKVVHTYTKNSVDVSSEILQGIADFVKTNLEGTGDSSYYVRYVRGDESVSGRTNSLYYKRYQMLNNRMNKTQGPLAMAARFLNSESMFAEINSYQNGLVESYKKFVKVTPISSMRPLSYFPTQEASGTTIQMAGKFYYQEELDELRKLINNKCILTCNYCEVRDSCPFYNEEEVLKLYCDEAQSIDVYLKDNELDLIYYDDDPNNLSPNLVYTSADGRDTETLDHSYLQKIHKEYSDILKKLDASGQIDASYNKRDLEDLRNQLRNKLIDYEDETRGGLGFLLNGRYGTLQVNDLSSLADPTSSMTNSELDVDELPQYKTMYDALFFEDEETEFLYTPSQHKYPVTLSMGPYGSKKIYRGTTRIKIPAGIKLLAEANPGDDLYLVSDDETDSTGKSITPVIYINKIKDVVYSFDLTDNGTDEEITDASDTNLYAKDVAQWSINIGKGWCLDDPIGSHEDKYLDQDQYWMETIRKPIVNQQGLTSYITLSGRSRASTGYQEPVIDSANYDETMAISGKPVVNSYINYTRKFMISMDCVQWVKPNSTLYPDLSYANKVETQKSVLPLMTTNLRLVLVKNRAANQAPLPECTPPTINVTNNLVYITATGSNMQIYYRIGDTGSYSLYTGPVEIKKTAIIYAYTIATNYEASDTVRYQYIYPYANINSRILSPKIKQTIYQDILITYKWENWDDYESYTSNPEANIVFEWDPNNTGYVEWTALFEESTLALVSSIVKAGGAVNFRVRDLNGFYRDSEVVRVLLPEDLVAPSGMALPKPAINFETLGEGTDAEFNFNLNNISSYTRYQEGGSLKLKMASASTDFYQTVELDETINLDIANWITEMGGGDIEFTVIDENEYYKSSPITIVYADEIGEGLAPFPSASNVWWTWNQGIVVNFEYEAFTKMPESLSINYVNDSMGIGENNIEFSSSIGTTVNDEKPCLLIKATFDGYGIMDVESSSGKITEESVIEAIDNHIFTINATASGYGPTQERIVFSTNNFVDTYDAPPCEAPVIKQDKNTISITCGTAEATIWYRLGATGTYQEYTGPFGILEDVVVYSYATAEGYSDSEEVSLTCNFEDDLPMPDVRIHDTKLVDGTSIIDILNLEDFPVGTIFNIKITNDYDDSIVYDTNHPKSEFDENGTLPIQADSMKNATVNEDGSSKFLLEVIATCTLYKDSPVGEASDTPELLPLVPFNSFTTTRADNDDELILLVRVLDSIFGIGNSLHNINATLHCKVEGMVEAEGDMEYVSVTFLLSAYDFQVKLPSSLKETYDEITVTVTASAENYRSKTIQSVKNMPTPPAKIAASTKRDGDNLICTCDITNVDSFNENRKFDVEIFEVINDGEGDKSLGKKTNVTLKDFPVEITIDVESSATLSFKITSDPQFGSESISSSYLLDI